MPASVLGLFTSSEIPPAMEDWPTAKPTDKPTAGAIVANTFLTYIWIKKGY